MDLSSEEITALPELKGMSFAPRSPTDGNQIVLSMSENGNTDIFITSLVKGTKRRLTTNRAIDTAPASRLMERVLCLKVIEECQQLYIISTEGGEAKRIALVKEDMQPLFGPHEVI